MIYRGAIPTIPKSNINREIKNVVKWGARTHGYDSLKYYSRLHSYHPILQSIIEMLHKEVCPSATIEAGAQYPRIVHTLSGCKPEVFYSETFLTPRYCRVGVTAVLYSSVVLGFHNGIGWHHVIADPGDVVLCGFEPRFGQYTLRSCQGVDHYDAFTYVDLAVRINHPFHQKQDISDNNYECVDIYTEYKGGAWVDNDEYVA